MLDTLEEPSTIACVRKSLFDLVSAVKTDMEVIQQMHQEQQLMCQVSLLFLFFCQWNILLIFAKGGVPITPT